MHYFHWIAGTILALAWLSRIVDAAIGMPSVADISTAAWDRNPAGSLSSGSPRVSIIVPARNEEADIEFTLSSLLELDYANYEVIAVNDRSTDRTGEIMEKVAANPDFSQKTREMGHPILRVIHHRDLPAGWMGKTRAMWTASNAATGDWLLFTDADVRFKPDSVRRAVAYAEAERADHVVLFPQMIMKSPANS
jgi:cellulose synthase/poly-beta-1,6-N-acetylglucosamine synthase-like glycosyltransferase